MTPNELKTAIEADPSACKRCGLIACSCWGSDGRGIGMAPTGKANLVAMKLAYDEVWDSFDTADLPSFDFDAAEPERSEGVKDSESEGK